MAYFGRLLRMAGAPVGRPGRGRGGASPASETDLERYEVREVGPAAAGDRRAERSVEPPIRQERRAAPAARRAEPRRPGVAAPGDERRIPDEKSPASADGASGETAVVASWMIESETADPSGPVAADTAVDDRTAPASASIEEVDRPVAAAPTSGSSPLADAGPSAAADGASEPVPAGRASSARPVERFQEAMVRVRAWMMAPPAEPDPPDVEPAEAHGSAEGQVPVAPAAAAAVARFSAPEQARELRVEPSPAPPPERPVEVSIGAIQVAVQEPPADRGPTAARDLQPGSRFSPSRYYLRG